MDVKQFSNPENIALSKFGVDFIKNIHELAVDDEIPDVQFHERGASMRSVHDGVKTY